MASARHHALVLTCCALSTALLAITLLRSGEPSRSDRARTRAGHPEGLPLRSKLVIWAYLLHLAMPALILADIVTSRLQGDLTRLSLTVAIVAGISLLWLLAGIGFLLATPDRRAFADGVVTPMITVYTIGLTLLLVETVIRVTDLAPGPSPLPLHQRMRVVTQAIDPAIAPGVSGAKTYTVNALGLRGPLPPVSGPAYKIVAVGGSSTFCFDLDDAEAWPQLLMNRMNAGRRPVPVWVGNAGENGFNSVNHIVLMQWLPGVIKPDMVIFLPGANDLGASLAFDGASTQAFLEKAAGFEGDLPRGVLWRTPKLEYPRLRRLKLLLILRQSVANAKQLLHPPKTLRPMELVAQRKLRATSPAVPLPDLDTSLREYRLRLLTLANRCRDLKLRCLFLTQPALWRSDLSPAEQNLLWTGNVGPVEHPRGFVSAGDLAKAIDLYNRTVLDVCRQTGLECLDLASRIPKDTSAFFDDVHFNENGSRLVAQVLKEYMVSRPPFGPPIPQYKKPDVRTLVGE